MKVTFRVVGLYLFKTFEMADLDLTPDSTVKELMDAIGRKDGDFTYSNRSRFGEVNQIQFTFQADDQLGDNVSQPPKPQTRRTITESEVPEVNGTSYETVWQYYRSVQAKGPDGKSYEFRTRAVNQQPFNQVTIGNGFEPPEGFTIERYIVTWRAIAIKLQPDQ